MDHPFTYRFKAMGSRLELVLFSVSHQEGMDLAERIQHIVAEIENCLSHFIDTSPVGYFNDLAKNNTRIQLNDPLLIEAVNAGLVLGNQTDGLFSIFNQPFAACLENDEVVLEKSNLRLDFGGMGKGLALDKIRKILCEAKIEQALVSFGESSILSLGAHPHGTHWPLGVLNPYAKGEMLSTLRVRDAMVSISSTIMGGRGKEPATFNAHIVDPRNGSKITSSRTAAVVGPSGVVVEALSTALIVASSEERTQLISAFEDCNGFLTEFDENHSPQTIYFGNSQIHDKVA